METQHPIHILEEEEGEDTTKEETEEKNTAQPNLKRGGKGKQERAKTKSPMSSGAAECLQTTPDAGYNILGTASLSKSVPKKKRKQGEDTKPVFRMKDNGVTPPASHHTLETRSLFILMSQRILEVLLIGTQGKTIDRSVLNAGTAKPVLCASHVPWIGREARTRVSLCSADPAGAKSMPGRNWYPQQQELACHLHSLTKSVMTEGTRHHTQAQQAPSATTGTNRDRDGQSGLANHKLYKHGPTIPKEAR
ncbi:hypothetical protein NDU88_003410 [Pleurodeles waltl]|uniref:Uncharacterized protein n=1 Tax=Pleurodeles waltl TaxID=8319 RepID=A0AAV7SDK0_PLEWA|nr:hypothetical protein NDU88_003410 [Pleurodeles waltl]